MSRTTSRGRAAGIGLGALAAVALVATPVAAAPVEDPVVLELDAASPEDLYVSVYGEIGDEDQASVLQAVPLPDSGRVDLTLPAPIAVPVADDLVLDVFDAEETDDAESPDELSPLELAGGVDVVVVPPSGEGDVTTLQLTFPVDDPGFEREDGSLVDDVTVSVLGLAVAGVPGTEVDTYFQLDLRPGRLAELLVVDPAPVEGYVGVELALQDVALTAGGSIDLRVPRGGVAEALGVGELGDVEAWLYPADEGGWFARSTTSRSFDVVSGDAGPLEAAVADGTAAEVLRDAAVQVVGDSSDEDVDEEDLYLEPTVAADGRSALLTSSADLSGGDYYLQVIAYSPDYESSLSASGLLDVTAAAAEPAPVPEPSPPAPAPQPTPTVTVTAPAAAPPATAPRRQNPGLRSNTGVETAVPGLSDGQLVGLGAGLLVLGSAAGAVALRSQRRARA